MKLSAYQVRSVARNGTDVFDEAYAGEVFVDGVSEGSPWYVGVGQCSAGWFVHRSGMGDYVPIAFQTRQEATAWLKFSHEARAPLMLTRAAT